MERRVRQYRLVAGALALVTLVLSFALKSTIAEREQIVSEIARQAASAATPAPDAADGGAADRGSVTVLDLKDKIGRLERVDAEKSDGEWWLYRSNAGSVVLRALSYQQLAPLHFHRQTEEALLPVFGDVEVTSYLGEAGKATRQGSRPGVGTLVDFPAYSTHSWGNRSDSHIAVALDFLTVPDDPKSYSDSYVQSDDDRLALGSPARVDDFSGELSALKASGEPFRLHWLDALGGRLGVLAVATSASLDAAPNPTILYVASGQGKLIAAGDRTLAASQVVFIPAGTPARIEGSSGEPLSLLLFQPGRDGVGELVRSGKKLYSQSREELIIRDFLKDRQGGVFLDVGAGHYQRNSNTFYLEEKLGWSGVAVDALGEYAADYQAHRPRTRFANYLITDQARGSQKFYRAGKALEVSSMSERIAQDQQGGGPVTALDVPSITLNELLGDLKVGQIDFLSMDIEEHEPAALAGFDLARFHPGLVCIEAHRQTRDAIFRYFHDRGYVRLDRYLPYDQENWYFVPGGT